jgi:transcriptional regulator with XRE-family HTH domain
MSDLRVGAAFRAVRLRRNWRQQDVADRAGVSRGLVSLIERGHVGSISVDALRQVGSVLEVRIDVNARWRGADLDRLLNAGHSNLAARVIEWLVTAGWEVAPEVSFSIYGERGVIDLLAWHAATRTLLVVELKTLIVDLHELIAVTDRKTRLAKQIGNDRGWLAARVATLVVVSDTTTNRRRSASHRQLLRSAYPSDGRRLRGWLRNPAAPFAALAFCPDANRRSSRPGFAGQQRVRTRRQA